MGEVYRIKKNWIFIFVLYLQGHLPRTDGYRDVRLVRT